jgi:hypothetical protein
VTGQHHFGGIDFYTTGDAEARQRFAYETLDLAPGVVETAHHFEEITRLAASPQTAG